MGRQSFDQLFLKISMSEHSSKGITPTCPLCKSQFDLYYRTPRIVPKCGHTFCEKCIANKLTTKANRKVFACPECSSEVVIRKSVADDVPKNIGIIDIVKNIKKYSTNEKQQQRKSIGQLCPQHNRPLDLTCQTCSYRKICSHCILFGDHHSHIYHKEAPATSIDLQEAKEVFHLLSNSVNLTLTPTAESNLKKTIKSKISEGLKNSVRTNMKQYYDILRKKQQQLLAQCDNLIISQGGIDKNIDNIISEYDKIKNRYDIDWSLAVQNTSFAKMGKVLTAGALEEFINRCQDLHTSIVNIQEEGLKHVQKILKSVGMRISQNVLFKIQQMPFSLKKCVENIGKPEIQKEIGSPERKIRLKSNNSQIKSKSVIQKQQTKVHHNVQFCDRNSNKSQLKSIISKKPKNNYSQIDKQQPQQDDFSLLDTGKSDINSYKQQTHNHKQLKELISNKNIGERVSLPPKASKPKIANEFDSKTITLKSKEQEKSKYISKDLSPAKTVNAFNKQTSSIVSAQGPLFNDELKFVRPTKQISFQLLSKFQEIMIQTDRQCELNTLELVGLDINDAILIYALDYLRMKKYRFQVIKLVKNVITDEGFKTILGYLLLDTSTQLLNMTSNHLTPRSLQLLLLFADKNSTLKTLYIGGNKINPSQLRAKKAQLSRYELQVII